MIIKAELDSAIREAYLDLGIPADRILLEPRMTGRFCDEVNAHVPGSVRYTTVGITKRLLALRKRGEARGGLPRLQRPYYGRG